MSYAMGMLLAPNAETTERQGHNAAGPRFGQETKDRFPEESRLPRVQRYNYLGHSNKLNRGINNEK
jgi:hypothetical protein